MSKKIRVAIAGVGNCTSALVQAIHYYKSQEKQGLGQNIINNFLQYLDIDKLDIGILDGASKVVKSVRICQNLFLINLIKLKN